MPAPPRSDAGTASQLIPGVGRTAEDWCAGVAETSASLNKADRVLAWTPYLSLAGLAGLVANLMLSFEQLSS